MTADEGRGGYAAARRQLVSDVAARVLAEVRAGMAARGGVDDEAALVPLVRSAAAGAGAMLGIDDVLAVTARIGAELWGLGALQPIVDDEGTTDVLVNAPDEVWADGPGGLRRVPCALGGETDVRALAVRLAASAGRRLDESTPRKHQTLCGLLTRQGVSSWTVRRSTRYSPAWWSSPWP